MSEKVKPSCMTREEEKGCECNSRHGPWMQKKNSLFPSFSLSLFVFLTTRHCFYFIFSDSVNSLHLGEDVNRKKKKKERKAEEEEEEGEGRGERSAWETVMQSKRWWFGGGIKSKYTRKERSYKEKRRRNQTHTRRKTKQKREGEVERERERSRVRMCCMYVLCSRERSKERVCIPLFFSSLSFSPSSSLSPFACVCTVCGCVRIGLYTSWVCGHMHAWKQAKKKKERKHKSD